jgi:hypothetical protein
VIRNGETKTVGPFTIEAVPMYNLKRGPEPGKLFHDKGRGNGYIVTYGGKRFYFSGDTEGTPEMRALKNIDLAFVCMNLPYAMPPDEAAEAVPHSIPRSFTRIITAARISACSESAGGFRDRSAHPRLVLQKADPTSSQSTIPGHPPRPGPASPRPEFPRTALP